MKLIQIAGYLGSGKTTLIVALGRRLSEDGAKVAILVNDVGSVPVDGKVIKEFGLTVKDIGGGCICCQVAGNMLRTLKLLAKEQKPDYTIIEPTGIAVPGAITETAMLEAQKLKLVIGPIIVLFDTTRAEKLLTYETLQRLVTTQLQDADIIALSKVDAVDEEQIKYAGESVSAINPSARVLRLSTVTGEGFPEVVRLIQEMTVNA